MDEFFAYGPGHFRSPSVRQGKIASTKFHIVARCKMILIAVVVDERKVRLHLQTRYMAQITLDQVPVSGKKNLLRTPAEFTRQVEERILPSISPASVVMVVSMIYLGVG
jgi:hypothetical protein